MTKYYQCDNRYNCRKTSSEHELVWVGEEGDGDPVCPHCWGFVSYAFAAVDQPEPSLGYCDGCDELEAELHLVDGDWLCDKCKATVIAVQEDKAKAKEIKTMAEALEDLNKGCTDHWEMIKARAFITLFLVWVCFAVWGKYVS
ncbi:hypothetical protein PHAGE_BARTON_54 [Acinetobacter phage Barton]|nr:hypothetical protein PHAGE_BARTON_54 [Acinetobacter phage Barton]